MKKYLIALFVVGCGGSAAEPAPRPPAPSPVEVKDAEAGDASSPCTDQPAVQMVGACVLPDGKCLDVWVSEARFESDGSLPCGAGVAHPNESCSWLHPDAGATFSTCSVGCDGTCR
jgi:hypothetical protein